MGHINRKLSNKETVFLLSSPSRVHVSSSIIRELSMYERRLENFVPEEIEEEVYEHLFNHYRKLKQANEKKWILLISINYT